METKQNSVVPVSTYLVKLFYISRMMNQTISTMGSKALCISVSPFQNYVSS